MTQSKSPTTVITIRLAQDMVDRIDDLALLVADEREFVLKARITRSDLVRYLLLQGLESLEEEASEAHTTDASGTGSYSAG